MKIQPVKLSINIFANYSSQIYVTLVGIIMLPMYIKYLGVEAYGLVGFFSMLQAWFQLLDMGLTPTMSREAARFHGGMTDALSLRRLLRAMEGVFVILGILGATTLIASSNFIAGNWLKVQNLSLLSVKNSVTIIATIVALRWISGLYRGAIAGFEKFVWLSYFNALMATARFVLVIPVFIYIESDIETYFSYQLFLAIIEIIVLVLQTYRLLPKLSSISYASWDWSPLSKVLKFSLSIAFTGSIWVLVTQTDKLILSKLLPLTDYAYFTLAVLVASGVTVISSPISAVLLSRMSKLVAQSDDEGLVTLYRNASQAVACLVIPTALVLACFAEQVLWAWTGNADITKTVSPVLALYALGNAILALAAFPYYLQFAKGNLRLHMIGNGIFIIILMPALILGTTKYGMIGAGWAWIISNTLYFLYWVPKVHKQFFKNIHLIWLTRDIAPVVFFAILNVFVLHLIVPWSSDRKILIAELILITVSLVILTAFMGSSYLRKELKIKFIALT